MNSNRLGPRRLGDADRLGGRGRPSGQPPRPSGPPDRTALYVGIGVGAGVLVLALAFAMSGSSQPAKTGQKADRGLKESIENAQRLGQAGNYVGAADELEQALRDPAYKTSALRPQALQLAEQYRQRIAFERDAVTAIEEFARRVEASKADQTAMKKAEEFWRESSDLLTKYGGTAKGQVLRDLRKDLERWRATGAQDVWQDDYNRTKQRIQNQHLDAGNFNLAVREWKRFQEPFDAPELKARVETELREIDRKAVDAATKLIEGAGTGAMARQKLEAEMERFMGTEGQKLIAQKLKTLP